MLQINRLVGPLVIQYQNLLLSPCTVSHYSTRVTSKPTTLFSWYGHHQSSFGAPAPSLKSFSSNTDQPDNYDSKTGAEPEHQSSGYRNKDEPHHKADLLGRPFANRDIDNRWQGLLHGREKVNDSTMGFPSYSGPVVSLHSAMQSNVPKPYFPNDKSSFPTHQNMPGGGVNGQQRFLYGGLHNTHPSNQKREESYPVKYAVPVHPTTEAKTTHIPESLNQPGTDDCKETGQGGFNTNDRNQSVYEERKDVSVSHHIQSSASKLFTPSQTFPSSLNNHSVGGSNEALNQKYVPDNDHFPRHFSHSGSTLGLQPQVTYTAPCPQGIQGNDCIYFELWMESCLRYGLNNCEEQLKNLKTGRKSLQQVLDEQQKIIEEVALNNKNKSSLNPAE